MTIRLATFAFVSAISLSACNLYAAIGDTVSQIEQRYGKPIRGPEVYRRKGDDFGGYKRAFYKQAGLGIVVIFEDGISARETLKKLDDSKFSQFEIEQILRAHGGDRHWVFEERMGYSGRNAIDYLSTDKKLSARIYGSKWIVISPGTRWR